MNMNFLDRFSTKSRISSFIKIRPARAKLFHADRRDMTKLIVAFRNFVNAPKHDHKSIMIVKIKTAQSEATKFT